MATQKTHTNTHTTFVSATRRRRRRTAAVAEHTHTSTRAHTHMSTERNGRMGARTQRHRAHSRTQNRAGLFLNLLDLLAHHHRIVAPNLLGTVFPVVEAALVLVAVPVHGAEQAAASALESCGRRQTEAKRGWGLVSEHGHRQAPVARVLPLTG